MHSAFLHEDFGNKLLGMGQMSPLKKETTLNITGNHMLSIILPYIMTWIDRQMVKYSNTIFFMTDKTESTRYNVYFKTQDLILLKFRSV